MVAFIDEHRDEYGVEPICAVLPIAPSTYYEHTARRLDPERRSARAKRDEELRDEIRRVLGRELAASTASRRCGASLHREGIGVARCTVERLMREMGLDGATRGRRSRDHGRRTNRQPGRPTS